MDSRATGAASLSRLAAELKAASRGDLRRELLRNIRAAAKPLGEAARKSALETSPKTGGLNVVVAATPIRVRSSLSGRNARVRLSDPSPHRLRSIDRGTVRHPTFGHDPWVNEAVTPGWWTKPMEAGSPPLVREAIIKTIDEVGRKLRG